MNQQNLNMKTLIASEFELGTSGSTSLHANSTQRGVMNFEGSINAMSVIHVLVEFSMKSITYTLLFFDFE